MNLEITSKSFFWVVVGFFTFLLGTVAFNSYSAYVNPQIDTSPMWLWALYALGASLVTAILYCTLTKWGPLKWLIYIWAVLPIISAATGILAASLKTDPTPIIFYIEKVALSAVAVYLVFGATKYIHIKSEPDA